MFRKRFFFLLAVAFICIPAIADECAGGGSYGCWASACVFTPEGVFIDGKGRDGWRRTEYIFPEEGPFKYRTQLFFDEKCTQAAPGEKLQWAESDMPFTRTRIETPLESTRIEHITFKPADWGKQPGMILKGRLTITDNVRLCFSRNLPFGEDGPAYDMQPLPEDGSGDVSNACLDRLMAVTSPDLDTSINLVDTEVPPYPMGYDSWQGNCVEFSSGANFGCNWTISILSTLNAALPVGVFAGRTLRYNGPMPISKVTDYLAYPEVPDDYVFAHFECELDGKADSAVVAVVKMNDSEWFADGLWARRLNTVSGKFEEIDPKRVRCISQGMGDGHLPEDGIEYLP